MRFRYLTEYKAIEEFIQFYLFPKQAHNPALPAANPYCLRWYAYGNCVSATLNFL